MFGLFKKKIDPISHGFLREKEFTRELNFRDDGGLILIDIIVHAKNYTFMLDTGAFSIVPSSFLKYNILTPYDEEIETLDASGHTQKASLYRLASLEVAGLHFEEFSVIVSDFTHTFPLSCLKFDGILGYNFLKTLILQINYKESKIQLSDRLNIPKNFKKIKMRRGRQKAPEFRINIQGKNFWIGLDSGKNDGLMLGGSKIINSLHKQANFIERTTGTFSSDFSGLNQHSFIDKYLLKEFSIEDKILIKSQIVHYEKSSLNIAGNSFLAHFEVIIDFKKMRLYLHPLLSKIESNVERSFGFLTFWSQEKRLYISAITQDTPAYNSKLKIGDKIMSINELDTLDFSQEEYCKHSLISAKTMLYKRSDTLLSIIVKRDGKLIREQLSLSP